MKNAVKTRTWPYGYTKRGRVEDMMKTFQFVKDQDGEGHILTHGSADESAKVGDRGTLTFTQGGPTGGYWKFQKDK